MTAYPADTMSGLLARGAEAAPAIGAPERAALTHGGLGRWPPRPWRR